MKRDCEARKGIEPPPLEPWERAFIKMCEENTPPIVRDCRPMHQRTKPIPGAIPDDHYPQQTFVSQKVEEPKLATHVEGLKGAAAVPWAKVHREAVHRAKLETPSTPSTPAPAPAPAPSMGFGAAFGAALDRRRRRPPLHRRPTRRCPPNHRASCPSARRRPRPRKRRRRAPSAAPSRSRASGPRWRPRPRRAPRPRPRPRPPAFALPPAFAPAARARAPAAGLERRRPAPAPARRRRRRSRPRPHRLLARRARRARARGDALRQTPAALARPRLVAATRAPRSSRSTRSATPRSSASRQITGQIRGQGGRARATAPEKVRGAARRRRRGAGGVRLAGRGVAVRTNAGAGCLAVRPDTAPRPCCIVPFGAPAPAAASPFGQTPAPAARPSVAARPRGALWRQRVRESVDARRRRRRHVREPSRRASAPARRRPSELDGGSLEPRGRAPAFGKRVGARDRLGYPGVRFGAAGGDARSKVVEIYQKCTPPRSSAKSTNCWPSTRAARRSSSRGSRRSTRRSSAVAPRPGWPARGPRRRLGLRRGGVDGPARVRWGGGAAPPVRLRWAVGFGAAAGADGRLRRRGRRADGRLRRRGAGPGVRLAGGARGGSAFGGAAGLGFRPGGGGVARVRKLLALAARRRGRLRRRRGARRAPASEGGGRPRSRRASASRNNRRSAAAASASRRGACQSTFGAELHAVPALVRLPFRTSSPCCVPRRHSAGADGGTRAVRRAPGRRCMHWRARPASCPRCPSPRRRRPPRRAARGGRTHAVWPLAAASCSGRLPFLRFGAGAELDEADAVRMAALGRVAHRGRRRASPEAAADVVDLVALAVRHQVLAQEGACTGRGRSGRTSSASTCRRRS